MSRRRSESARIDVAGLKTSKPGQLKIEPTEKVQYGRVGHNFASPGRESSSYQ